MRRSAPLLAVLLVGCPASHGDDAGTDAGTDASMTCRDDCERPECADRDGDGFDSVTCGGADCDDGDDETYPDALERCDGVDNDCDGDIDTADEFLSEACTVPETNALFFCRDARCSVGDRCYGGFLDCNRSVDDGCEVDATIDPRNCGGCGRACACGAGRCDDARTIEGLSAGELHTCVLLGTGEVMCWGDNEFHQLGDPSVEDFGTPEPVRVVGLDDGAQLFGGAWNSCVVRRDGRLSCWGRDDEGQLGPAGSAPRAASPVDVPGMDESITVGIGGAHLCAARPSGVWCWGRGLEGQLGNGTFEGSRSPVRVQGLPDEPATELAVGRTHSCALVSGRVYCWGGNAMGELGDGSFESRATAGPVAGVDAPVAAIASFADHSCLVMQDGTGRCWGLEAFNRTGYLPGATFEELPEESVPIPRAVVGLRDAVDIEVGGHHSCAILQTRRIACFGPINLTSPELFTGLERPTTVGIPDAAHLGLGATHTVVARATQTLLVWGEGPSWHLGWAYNTAVGMPLEPDNGF